MAVTQYIGSRYVPLFADPIDWDITRAYEPLTIVYYQGNSYTSKQAVPTGIDVTNTTYWAITGNYNAQVEQYRREVQTFDGRITANAQAIADEVTARMSEDTAIRALITDLQTDLTAEESAREAADTQIRTDFAAADTQIRTDFTAADTTLGARIATLESTPFDGDVVLLGDSYAEGFTPDGNFTSWMELAKTALNRRGINVYSRFLGGIGIVHERDGVNFATLLNQLGNTLTDAQKNKVGTVFIGGGWNDGYAPSVSDFRNGINALETYAHTHFNKAKIIYDWFGFGNWLKNSDIAYQSISTTTAIANAFYAAMTSDYKNMSILDSTYLLRKASYFSSDGIHPSQIGQQKLANHVIDVLNGVFDIDAKRYGLVGDIPINGMIDGDVSTNTAAMVKSGGFEFNQTNIFMKGIIVLNTTKPVEFTGPVFSLYTTSENALVFGTDGFDIPITLCLELQNSNADIKGNYVTVSGFFHCYITPDTHRMQLTFYSKSTSADGYDYLRGDLKQIQFPAPV